MRVTQHSLITSALSHLRRQTATAARNQAQIASGQRVVRPSDDPAATLVALNETARISRYDSRAAALNRTGGVLREAEVQTRDAASLLARAREIGLAARQATDQQERQAYATEVESIRTRMLDIANSQHEGVSLFSGRDASRKPFVTDSSGIVRYAGHPTPMRVQVGDDIGANVLLPGNQVFRMDDRQPAVIVGNSGLRIGAGVPTGTGIDEIRVRHLATSITPGAGVTSGTSTSEDTILGPMGAHELEIVDASGTGASGTVRLNGGEPISFTSADTDLRVVGRNGEVIHLNMTAIVPGFSGSVAVGASGTVSTDGGLTEVTMDFSGSQQVVDSLTGAVSYLDTSQVRQAGINSIEHGGTADVFQFLDELHGDLTNTRNLATGEWNASLTRRLEDAERLHEHVLGTVTFVSVAQRQINEIVARDEELTLDAESIRNDAVAADLPAAITELQQVQLQTEFTMAALTRVFSTTLLDFLR